MNEACPRNNDASRPVLLMDYEFCGPPPVAHVQATMAFSEPRPRLIGEAAQLRGGMSSMGPPLVGPLSWVHSQYGFTEETYGHFPCECAREKKKEEPARSAGSEKSLFSLGDRGASGPGANIRAVHDDRDNGTVRRTTSRR
jgi:hypothetical protein